MLNVRETRHEDLMKERFIADLCDKDFKFISGIIKNLTDVDLALDWV